MGILNWLFGLKDTRKVIGKKMTGTRVSERLMNDRPNEPVAATSRSSTEAPSEVIQIGTFGSRIVSVTKKRIEYIDMSGQEQYVDLEECARSWEGWHDAHKDEFIPLDDATEQSIAAWNSKCVGERGAMGNPSWVKFRNKRKTCFEFETFGALYGELLIPLEKAGWHTFDTN